MRGKVKVSFLSTLVFALAWSGCASTADLHRRVDDVYYNAQVLIHQKKYDQAAQLLVYLRHIRPNDPQIEELLQKLPSDIRAATDVPNWMGVSRALRVPESPPWWKRVLWYLPDRFGDFLEIFSFRLSIGVAAGGGVWFTRGAQATAFAGYEIISTEVPSLKYMRWGATPALRAEVGALAFGAAYVTGGHHEAAGMRPYYVSADRALWLHSPTDPLYSRYRDYYAVGGEAHLFFFGLTAEIHLLEIWDFFAGWILLDPLNDDRATTRSMERLGRTYDGYLNKMLEAASDVTYKELVEYRAKPPPLLKIYRPTGAIEDTTKGVPGPKRR